MPRRVTKNFDAIVFWVIEIHGPGITVRDRHDIGDTLVLSQDLVHGLDRVEIVDSKGEMRDVVAAATVFSGCRESQLMMVGFDLAQKDKFVSADVSSIRYFETQNVGVEVDHCVHVGDVDKSV